MAALSSCYGVPIADAYYESDDPEKVEKEWKIMRKTAERLKKI